MRRPSGLSERLEKVSFSFARLPNLAIFSEFMPCFSLDLTIQTSNSGSFFSLRQALSGGQVRPESIVATKKPNGWSFSEAYWNPSLTCAAFLN